MLRLGIALVALTVSGGASAGEAVGGEAAAEHEPVPAPATEARATRSAGGSTKAKAATKAKATSRRSSRSRARRYKFTGGVVPEEKLRDGLPPPPSGNLFIHNIATDETLKVNVFNPDGSYSVDALKAVTHLLRCKRTDTEKEIEPRLLAVLSHVYDHFGGKRIEVVSGFRNQRRTSSYHYKASAADIRVPGVKPLKLRAFVESLDAGGMGIGLYPRTGFVHVDVRPPPSYRWIDYSPADPDNPDKRPPRGVTRKKRLQS